MIKEWIAEYNPQNEDEILSAMREIMQEIALAALSRTDFFDKVGILTPQNSRPFLESRHL